MVKLLSLLVVFFFKLIVLIIKTLLQNVVRDSEIYIVVIEGDPVVNYNGNLPGLVATAEFYTHAWRAHHHSSNVKDAIQKYKNHLSEKQDQLLKAFFKSQEYTKLYSYHHLLNGFAVKLTAKQAELLKKTAGVIAIQKSYKVKKTTVHTPEYIGLVQGIWEEEGGPEKAGEDMIIGIVDTGIDPTHPSFAASGGHGGQQHMLYTPLPNFRGICEVAEEFPRGSCNGKIIGARHFAAAAIEDGAFNASLQFASPLDGDGHGSHTASTAAGNHGVPVIVDGVFYGNASGVAPRARIAVYKALYRMIGGFIPDVVAACDQAVADGVDILSLSLGPNSPPGASSSTFLNILDLALLNAVKANVLVVQAAGNGGPYEKSMASFSPWVVSVAAGVDDRSYPNTITLSDQTVLPGIALAPPTRGDRLYGMVLANDAVMGETNALYTPSDCQEPSLFDPALVHNRLLVCTYSFNFIFGGSTMQQVVNTVQALGGAGFIMVVESDIAGSKFDPIPLPIPAIVLTVTSDSQVLLGYYDKYTEKDAHGKPILFGAEVKISDGQIARYSGQAQQVALFSSRGPDVADFQFDNADVLKPNIMAPGYLIWAAWSPLAIDNLNYMGQRWAMISGTSMATPHVAGLAALLKAQNPLWSPAALASAMMTTADILDHNGKPLLAQQLSGGTTPSLEPATPFDMGSGALNINAALNPGLVFAAGHGDYIGFLCASEGVRAWQVNAFTGGVCPRVAQRAADLNMTSITLANLTGIRVIPRTVTNVANHPENYTITWTDPADVVMAINPTTFSIGIGSQKTQVITFTLRATQISSFVSFGNIMFKGNLGHTVRIPVSVINKQL
ncbi:unnamed protein product [Sphagnum compactum]